MADEIAPDLAAFSSSSGDAVSITHQEFYTAADGSLWCLEAEVRWLPHYKSMVRISKMPHRIPIVLPSNLPYQDVVPIDVREAAVDGDYDLQAITRFYLQRTLNTLREYIEQFGSNL